MDRMTSQGVYPEVAEYWWTQFVWESPKLDPEKRIQLQGRLGSAPRKGLRAVGQA